MVYFLRKIDFLKQYKANIQILYSISNQTKTCNDGDLFKNKENNR